jgi:hypothetical protein
MSEDGVVLHGIEHYARVPEWVLYSDVSSNAIRLWAVLIRHQGPNGIYPARKRLAEQMHCSLDTVDRALKELVAISAVEVEHRTSEDGDLLSSRYHLFFSQGDRKDAVTCGGNGAVTGDRKDAAQTKARLNESPYEPELAAAGDSAAIARLVDVWHKATTSTVTALFTEWLAHELEEGFPEDWLADAIRETGENGVKKWSYTKAIVQRWKSEGRDADRPDMEERFGAPKPNGLKPPSFAERQAYLASQKKDELFE